MRGPAATGVEIAAAMEALATLGRDSDDQTCIAFTFGDGEAEAGGWRTVGGDGDTGLRVCGSLAADDPHREAARRWTPAI